MSEVEPAVAAPVEVAPAPPPVVEEVAPAVTPEPPPAVAPAQEGPPLPPRSPRLQARAKVQEKAAAAAAAYKATLTPGVVDERGNTHAKEDGTFMEEVKEGADVKPAPVEGATPVAPAEPAVPAAPVAEPVSDDAPPAAPVAGTDFVTIALDPNGPLADQGVSELSVPAAIERQIRTLANAATRQRDTAETKLALDQAHLENARLSARVQALTDGTPIADPLEVEMLAQIKEHYPDQVEGVEKALAEKRDNATTQKEADIYAEIQREHVAKSFMQNISTTSAQKYPAWAAAGELNSRMASAMSQYGDYVDARNLNLQRTGQAPTEPTAAEFYGWVDTQYIRDPRVQEQVKQYRNEQQEKSRSGIAAQERQKLATKEKATLDAAAERHAARPPSTPGIPSQGTTPPPAEGNPAKTSGDRAKALRQGIRNRYKQPA